MLCNFWKDKRLILKVEQPPLTLEQSRFSKSQFVETRVENNLKRRLSSQDCFSILASSVALYSRESGCKQIVINETKVFSLFA